MPVKGSIRMLVGFLIVFGAVGTLDVEPDANLLVQFALAIVGLVIAYSGILANQRQKNG